MVMFLPKAVLMAVRPKWCRLIFNGKKRVEVRLSVPKLKPPFKCYVYESLADKTIEELQGQQKIIGEFICNRICEIPVDGRRARPILKDACLSLKELETYRGYKTAWGWNISSARRYETPKELYELFTPMTIKEEHTAGGMTIKATQKRITTPPQSWRYCEAAIWVN